MLSLIQLSVSETTLLRWPSTEALNFPISSPIFLPHVSRPSLLHENPSSQHIQQAFPISSASPFSPFATDDGEEKLVLLSFGLFPFTN